MSETDDRAASRGSAAEGESTSVIQPASRRERRALEAAAAAASADAPAAAPAIPVAPVIPVAPAIPLAPAAVAAIPVPHFTAPAAAPATPAAVRAEPAAVPASSFTAPPAAAPLTRAAAPHRPASPSAAATIRSRLTGAGTMAAVAAIVGVFAIPAYAIDTDGAISASAAASVAQQGQDFAVDDDATLVAGGRDTFGATSYAEILEQQASLYRSSYASSVRAEGDDYPWRGQEGLSELGYFMGQCTDFVAWRLNRDAGATAAPWRYTWSYMTPWGGDASQWLSAWYEHGWPVSTTPVAGAVAWFGGNHVGYVKEVYSDGSFMVEDYNRVAWETYGKQIFAPGSIPYFLYPPG